MKVRERGKQGPQLIYSCSANNERPGVWMVVILVSLSAESRGALLQTWPLIQPRPVWKNYWC